MTKRVGFLCAVLLISSWHVRADVSVKPDGVALVDAPLSIEISLDETSSPVPAKIYVDGVFVHAAELSRGEQKLRVENVRLTPGAHTIDVRTAAGNASVSVSTRPGWLSLLPPVIALVLALLLRDVIVALFSGLFAGTLVLYDWNPLRAAARAIDGFVAPAMADLDHAKLLVFTALIGGMVGAVSRSGGTLGIVERIRGYATTARRGQLATWMMGMFIFFDDYANTLIVGSTMRPLTDRLRISREKLAYIVDSTAAPVASLFPISTWIGFEVGLIAAAFTQLDIPLNAYGAFVASIPFRFYPIFALVLGFTIAFTCRDFGPMLRAELRASRTGKVVADNDVPLADYSSSTLAPPPDAPHRAFNAVIPILIVMFGTVAGLLISGSASVSRSDHPGIITWLREVLGNANSFDALLWASLAAAVAAVALPVFQRILSLRHAMEALGEGMKSMMVALAVLVLAWAIGDVCAALHTADYVVGLTAGVLSPQLLPVVIFVAGAAIAFGTGTSWGTMAILMPLAIPIAHGLSVSAGVAPTSPQYYALMVGTISSVLAGSVWGDHCSPISDTTILSSSASGSDHIAHVKTQLPYALAIGVLSMLLGDIATGYGLSPWLAISIGSVLIIGVVVMFGKRSDWDGRSEAEA